jgi:hypothetical protein
MTDEEISDVEQQIKDEEPLEDEPSTEDDI